MTPTVIAIRVVGAFVFAGTRYPMAIEWGPYLRPASSFYSWGLRA